MTEKLKIRPADVADTSTSTGLADGISSASRRPAIPFIGGFLAGHLSALARAGFSGEQRHASLHVLRDRQFLGYFIGSLTSNLGTWLQNTAQMLLAYRLTHSAMAVGLVTSAQFSGFLLLGPLAGNIANRLGSKPVLIVTQLVSAGTAGAMAILVSSGSLTEAELIGGALVIGLAFTFAVPLQTAIVPRLVADGGISEAKAALAMNSASYNAGRTLAPVLAVVVLASIGPGSAFALNAISFVVFAIVIMRVHPGPDLPPGTADRGQNSISVALRHPRILLLLAMVATVTLADDPILVLGPALVHQVLHVSSDWPAYFLSALGAGTVLGVLVPTKPPSAFRAAMPLLLLASSVIVFSYGFSPSVSWIAALAAGMAGLLTGSSTQALLINVADPQQAAQVMALWAVAWAGTKPLASLADGYLATHLGVFQAGVALTAPAIAVATLELCLPSFMKNKAKTFVRLRAGQRVAYRSR